MPRVHRLPFSVQSPASRVQCLESGVQNLASKLQRPGSSAQHSATTFQGRGLIKEKSIAESLKNVNYRTPHLTLVLKTKATQRYPWKICYELREFPFLQTNQNKFPDILNKRRRFNMLYLMV